MSSTPNQTKSTSKKQNKTNNAGASKTTTNKTSSTATSNSTTSSTATSSNSSAIANFPQILKQQLSNENEVQENNSDENDEDELDDDDEEYQDNTRKEQSATDTKMIQSRPVMFSGNIKDFLLYKRHLLMLLSGCNLLEELKPKSERNKKYKSSKMSRTRTITMINSTLPQKTADSFLELFEVSGDFNLDIKPAEYWKAICSRYEKNTELNKALVHQELQEEKLKGNEPIDDYNGRLTTHFQRLRSFGEDMYTKEESKKFHLLKGLPVQYKNYTQAMSLQIATMSYEDVITHLTNFQESLRAEEKKVPEEEAQLVTKARTNYKNEDQAAYVRSFGNGRGRGRFTSFRGRGVFNPQRREYNRPNFRSYSQNSFSNYRPKELFSNRGSGRSRGSFRGRARMNYNQRNFIDRRSNNDSHNNNNNSNANRNSNNDNNNQNQQDNQRQSLACWKCGQPGHKSLDCRSSN